MNGLTNGRSISDLLGKKCVHITKNAVGTVEASENEITGVLIEQGKSQVRFGKYKWLDVSEVYPAEEKEQRLKEFKDKF